ncbi:MAG TPA: cellulase family glycosylhydrolase [Armatimonadota bacterium]|jgi:hypothetical protein
MLHRYSEYGWLRGFNLVPSWGARIEQAWWDYDPAAFRRELAPLRLLHANTIRLWLEFTAWMADPAGVLASFLDAVAAADEHGLKTMPCLFNRWHDARWDYGGTYQENLTRDLTPHFEYVRAVVEPLAADERVLIWDLCNEPATSSLAEPGAAYELHWLAAVADTVRRAGAQQPLTLGTHQGGESMNIHAPLMDVLCCHPYAQGAEAVQRQVARARAVQERWGKPMLCNEVGIGSLSDAARAANARLELTACAEAGWGWMGWAPHPGRAISTRRDRYDANGVDGEGYHPWFDETGHPRPGLEWLQAPPIRRAPWEG